MGRRRHVWRPVSVAAYVPFYVILLAHPMISLGCTANTSTRYCYSSPPSRTGSTQRSQQWVVEGDTQQQYYPGNNLTRRWSIMNGNQCQYS
ncbi:hypothetical protein M378DRAFT_636068 [Amanita muscaria Koide BX008]|uniref:Uncharacterized protein n=1 Tax=Amanita muscaria (strain Koide BX008) TaxID=946122 RepID=A0A0C2SLR0_AMAMK|nr:hypothetical protein M378DRAFT_636068 [Amanita muscaria Koide BX008]